MGLPPVKAKSGSVEFLPMLALEFPEGVMYKNGTTAVINDTREGFVKNAQILGGSLPAGVSVQSYAVQVTPSAVTDMIDPQAASYNLENGTIVRFRSTGTLNGNITAGAGYYWLNGKISTNMTTTIDILGGASGTHYMMPSQPVEIGGTAFQPALALTLTAQNTNVLGPRSHSFRITKPASFAIGDLVSVPFTIGTADRGQIIEVSFDYDTTATAGYTDGDIQVWVRDTVNNKSIQLTPTNLLNGKDKFVSKFQSSINSSSYVLMLYYQGFNQTAQTIDLDNFQAKRQDKVYGAISTDWTEFPVTVLGVTTSPTVGAGSTMKGYYKRSADTCEVMYVYKATTAGTAGSGHYLWPLPAGLKMDTSKLILNNNTAADAGSTGGTDLGNASAGHLGTDAGVGYIAPYSDSYVRMILRQSAGATQQPVGSGYFNMGLTNLSYQARFSVPIVGWGSNQLLSSESDSRICAARAYATANRTINNTTVCNFDTVDYDTHGAITTGSSWNYKAPLPGIYRVSISTFASPAAGTSTTIVVNSTPKASLTECGTSGQFSGSCLLKLNAGDLVAMRGVQATSATLSYNNNPFGLAIQIDRLTGPAQIAASESCYADYTTTAGQAIATGLGTPTIINFDTRTSDSHLAAVTGAAWKWTAPAAMRVMVTARIQLAISASAPVAKIHIYKNGARYTTLDHRYKPAVSDYFAVSGSRLVEVLAGDYLDIRLEHNAGSTYNLDTQTQHNYVSIVKV